GHRASSRLASPNNRMIAEPSAFAKAYRSASFKTDTTALVERSKTVPVLANLFKLPHLLLLGGGIVIKLGDGGGRSARRRRGAGRRSRRRLRPCRPGQDQGPAQVTLTPVMRMTR